MSVLSQHDINETLEFLNQQLRDAELDNYRLAFRFGHGARVMGKPREAMYGEESIDNAWLDGWDAGDAELSQPAFAPDCDFCQDAIATNDTPAGSYCEKCSARIDEINDTYSTYDDPDTDRDEADARLKSLACAMPGWSGAKWILRTPEPVRIANRTPEPCEDDGSDYQDFIFGKRGLPSRGVYISRYETPLRHFGIPEEDHEDYLDNKAAGLRGAL